MKAYRVTLQFVDHDELGPEEIKNVFEYIHYPNYCMNPDVCHIEERDIGEWSDDLPINQRATCNAEFDRLFGTPASNAKEKKDERSESIK